MPQSGFSVSEAETFTSRGVFLLSTMVKGHVQVFKFSSFPVSMETGTAIILLSESPLNCCVFCECAQQNLIDAIQQPV